MNTVSDNIAGFRCSARSPPPAAPPRPTGIVPAGKLRKFNALESIVSHARIFPDHGRPAGISGNSTQMAPIGVRFGGGAGARYADSEECHQAGKGAPCLSVQRSAR